MSDYKEFNELVVKLLPIIKLPYYLPTKEEVEMRNLLHKMLKLNSCFFEVLKSSKKIESNGCDHNEVDSWYKPPGRKCDCNSGYSEIFWLTRDECIDLILNHKISYYTRDGRCIDKISLYTRLVGNELLKDEKYNDNVFQMRFSGSSDEYKIKRDKTYTVRDNYEIVAKLDLNLKTPFVF